jgi:hypothetical protein
MSAGLAASTLKAGDDLSEWDQFVANSPQGCIFCRSWWLDAVCPNGYEILVLQKGDRIVAGMPLVRCRRFGYEAIGMPPLTQTLGILLETSSAQRYESRLSADMELLRAMVRIIPSVPHFAVNFHHSFTNWLPFYWAGYQQTTRYTYVIEDLTDLEAVFANFARSKRQNIVKAERLVQVREDMPPRDFYDHHATSLRKAGDTIVYTYELFDRIYRATHEHNAGKTWLAVDVDGHIHSAIFVVFDRRAAYYLINTLDPDYHSSNSATLLVKRAIEYVATRTKRFDFEGSMIENVERSFRSFGARQIPYFRIYRDKRNPLVKTYRELRSAGAALAHKLGLRR